MRWHCELQLRGGKKKVECRTVVKEVFPAISRCKHQFYFVFVWRLPSSERGPRLRLWLLSSSGTLQVLHSLRWEWDLALFYLTGGQKPTNTCLPFAIICRATHLKHVYNTSCARSQWNLSFRFWHCKFHGWELKCKKESRKISLT